MMDVVKFLISLAAAVCMIVPAVRHPKWRGGLAFLSCVFLASAANALEGLFGVFDGLLGPYFKEPELLAIAFFLLLGAFIAWRNRGSTITALSAVYRNRRFPMLLWGLLFISVLPNVVQSKTVWGLFSSGAEISHETRETAENLFELVGSILILNWAILFLKDKWKVLEYRPSPHAHLVFEHDLVEVGHGSRRTCYRIGETGFCVKFYKRPDQCVKGKMKRSVRRDIAWRRFSKARNSSSREVYVYELFRHSLPPAIREKLPPVVERVYHPIFGWGILETYYTNPDGTAIIPYEYEIKRQTSEPNKREIYIQARDLLIEMIAASAYFYEPGNFHTLFTTDGRIETKIIDFEPESKMLIPLEVVSAAYRRWKLRRKAKRYLKHIRETYHVDVTVDTPLG